MADWVESVRRWARDDAAHGGGGGGGWKVSLAVPPKAKLDRTVETLDAELVTATANADADADGGGRARALRQALTALREVRATPPNGLVVLASERAFLGREPPAPLASSLYLLDTAFHTEPLNQFV